MWDREQLARLRDVLKRHGCADPARVMESIGEIVAVYGAQHMPPDRAAVYAKYLADLDPDALAGAVAELVLSSKWPPSVAEIRERVTARALDAAGVSGSPEDAWSEVLRKVRSIGTLRVPGKDTEHGPAITFDDPVTNAFMDAHTWRALGQSTDQQLPSERRAFIDRYKAAIGRQRHDLQVGRALQPKPARGAIGPGEDA